MASSSMRAYYSVTTQSLTVSFGISLNLLLLFLIGRYSNVYLGKYKYLLAIFACYDVFLCIMHGLLNPVVIVLNNTFGAALYSPWQNREITSMFYSCFTIPFALMNIHFLYRYWNIAHPPRLALFSKGRFVSLISLYPITQGVIWFACAISISTDRDDYILDEIKALLTKTHSQSIIDGWLVMDHWRNGKLNVPVLYVIIVCNSIIFGSLIAATTLGTLTYRKILEATNLSSKLITMQYALLVAVCAQTFVPLLCVYIPYFLIIMCPFFGITVFGMVGHYSLLISIFPGWDALVIIILIRDYRIGFAKLIGLRKEPKIIIGNTQFTSAFQHSMI